MFKTFRLLTVLVLIAFSSFAMAANKATGFIYPVGIPSSPPTEQIGNANGFVISQNFNTSSFWAGGGANGGWCNNGADTSMVSCESHGSKWFYGHTGVDLSNQVCGAEIRATAEGVVEFSGGYPGYGYLLKIKHTLPTGRIVYSLYGHRDSAMMNIGDDVTKGQVVGYIGNTISETGSRAGPCHLHFAIFDEAMPPPVVPVGYVYNDKTGVTAAGNPITPNIIRYFYDPLLFVNDRNNESQKLLPGIGYWAGSFSSSQSVETRTMFVVDSVFDTRSLQVAVNSGWMGSDVHWWTGSSWVHYTGPYPIEAYTIPSGGIYAFNMLRSDLTLHWFVPGNNYLDARWRQDMSDFTNSNAGLGFGRGLRETYSNDPNWTPNYGITYMGYDQTVGGVTYNATVSVAYSKNDPLERYVSYFDPQTGIWSDWIRVH